MAKIKIINDKSALTKIQPQVSFCASVTEKEVVVYDAMATTKYGMYVLAISLILAAALTRRDAGARPTGTGKDLITFITESLEIHRGETTSFRYNSPTV